MEDSIRSHWEQIYRTRLAHQVSWTQQVPRISLELIAKCPLGPDAKIIDVGGGDSRVVDYLLRQGFTDITVLDISGESLSRARNRLGAAAAGVKWVEADIREFSPAETYDLWHDRATFHFLHTPSAIDAYRSLLHRAATGYLIIGTFSTSGPDQCSGLPVHQYDEVGLKTRFADDFECLDCVRDDHVTPFSTTQNFVFCRFRRRHA